MEIKERESRKTNVLFVDGDEGIRGVFNFIFNHLGVPTVIVDSADEAVEKLEKEVGFSHVIVDGLRGRWKEVVEEAQKQQTPNIFVHSAEPEIEREANEAGAKFILKDPGKSFDAIKEILGEK